MPPGAMENSMISPCACPCGASVRTLPVREMSCWFDDPMYGSSQASVLIYGPAMRRSVTPRSRFQAGSVPEVSCSYVYPVYVTTVRPAFWTCSPTDASASAWKKGSPPENVTPSISLMARIRPAISSEETMVAGENDQNTGLKHPLQWIGHPCTQTTARMPGPFAADLARKSARLSTLLRRRPWLLV